MGRASSEAPAGFRHEAMWYADREALLVSLGAWIGDGIAAGEPALVVLDADACDALRSQLGAAGAADVGFVDMRSVGRNPARIIPAWRGFVERYPAGTPMRGIGEPVWSGRDADELVECAIHETLLNLALADVDRLELRCPYDVRRLAPSAIASAERSHPLVTDGSAFRANAAFAPGVHRAPLPPAPSDAEVRSFDRTDLPSLRSWVRSWAGAHRLAAAATDDLVLASGEVVGNSIRHGGGTGVVALWRTAYGAACEVRDRGWIRDALAGRREPRPGQDGGFGLWIANQVCDLVQIRSAAGRTVVRLRVSIDH